MRAVEQSIERTLAGHRAALEQIVVPQHRAAAESELNELVAEASRLGTGEAHRLQAEAARNGSEAFDRAVEVRDDARALAELIRSGRISVDDARNRLGRLQNGLRLSRAQATLFEHDSERAAVIAADPVEYAEDLYRRFPPIRPRCSF